MKATGLIVEYNPFHNGHLYHLTESLKQSQADVLIVVMSGHFTHNLRGTDDCKQMGTC